jgi:hypothetical protein
MISTGQDLLTFHPLYMSQKNYLNSINAQKFLRYVQIAIHYTILLKLVQIQNLNVSM